MKKIVVNFCGNCPFLYSDYNDFSIGYSTIDICTLSKFYNHRDYCISAHNEVGFDEKSKTPEWCPLQKENFEFIFKEFSPERVQEIDEVKKDIKEIEDFFDSVDYDENSNYKEKEDKLQELYNKYIELQKNEEIPFYEEEIKEDINSQVDEINRQLEFLEKAGEKLKSVFEDINNIDLNKINNDDEEVL